MEESIQIGTDDDHIIYGTLNWQEPRSNKLIIFVHGLKGNINRHSFFNGAKFFPKNGFTTFRFNLYSSNDKGRILHECSLRTHASDIDTVVDHFEDKYEEIHLIGASLGGPSIIYSSQNVKSVVLWDPSLVLDKLNEESWEFDDKKNLYIMKTSKYTLISKEIYEDWQNSGTDMLKDMRVPTNIICAEKSPLPERWKKALDKIPVEYEFEIIKGAGHNFDEEGCEEKLFEETLKFLT